MAKHRRTIAARLDAARVAIHNSLAETDVQTMLTEYGYDTDRLQQGRTLYERALALVQQQSDAYGEQTTAQAELEQAQEHADEIYLRHVKLARIALKADPVLAQRLGLGGDRKRSLSGWLHQARTFYHVALGDSQIVARLAPVGLTRTKLEQGQSLISAVEAADEAQGKERGEAQKATKERDAALDALDEWVSDLVAIAHIALETDPQLIEKLGIVEPS